MNFPDVKRDCKHFKGQIPCSPNKEKGYACPDCPVYQPIETRILIIKLAALGDVIRTTPLLAMYRSKYPNAHITWLTQSPTILPEKLIDQILPFDSMAIFVLENSMFDIVVNLDKEPAACILMSKIESKFKYGFTWNDHAIAPCTPVAEHKLMTGFFDELSKENRKSYLEEIFEICHEEFNFEPYAISLNESINNRFKEKLDNIRKDKIVIGLNTGCGPRWNTRLWKDEYWIELAAILKAQGYFPMFLGGELEHERNEKMALAADVYYPGHFDLETFICLTNTCELIVTQVTMMMHIATALQKKMVLMNTIFNPFEFELYGRGKIIGPAKPCECYFGNTCKNEKPCMHDILPESICEAINSIQV